MCAGVALNDTQTVQVVILMIVILLMIIVLIKNCNRGLLDNETPEPIRRNGLTCAGIRKHHI